MGQNVTLLVPTKLSNLTQYFGGLVDMAGETSSYQTRPWERPGHWHYCIWKMQHIINEYKLFSTMTNLFDCDGRCTLPDLDQNFEKSYKQRDSIYKCFWGAENDIGVDENNLDAAKIELCRSFKTLVENCSIPVGDCIEQTAIREIVMAEFLKDMVARTNRVIKFVENYIPDFYGGFSYDDCVIFGGDVSGTSSISASFLFIIVTTSTLYFVL